MSPHAHSTPSPTASTESKPLAFAPHLDVAAVEGAGLAVGGEGGEELYRGPEFTVVGRLIDGNRGRGLVLSLLFEDWRERGTAALDKLMAAGVVVEKSAAEGAESAWWTSLGVEGGVARARIASAVVTVRALGDSDAGPLERHLQRADVTIRGSERSLLVVLVDDYLEENLGDVNAEALETGRPWLLARSGHAVVHVGPVFRPDRGPCWVCLAQRVRANGAARMRLGLPVTGPGRRGPRLPPALAELATTTIATEILRYLAGASAELDTQVIATDLRTHSTARHHVVWRPQCPACGVGDEPLPPTPRPVVLSDAPTERTGRELRGADPTETIKRFQHHVSPFTGAVAMVSRRSRSSTMHAYLSGGPVATVHGEKSGSERWAGGYSGGKGTTDAEAHASALCEALERYSGGYFGDEPRRVATLDELGEAAVAPNAYMNFSDRQFARRAELNAIADHKSSVPEPHDPGQPIAFTPAWSLTASEARWLPTALCFYGARVPGQEVCLAESNGNAAGNSLDEAILHGVLELIERDHVALWWYNRLRLPAVDLGTISDPWLEEVRTEIGELGRELWVLDLTADLGIPAAAAIACDGGGSDVGLGFGAHLDLASAALRAISELIQLGLGAPSGGLGSGPSDRLRAGPDSFLRPDPDAPPVGPGARFDGAPRDGLDDVKAAVERAGLELIVLDQTRPDIGLPVVKAVVPGLRHFWPRLGPGRLYAVPVALGRLASPLREEDLNPEPPTS